MARKQAQAQNYEVLRVERTGDTGGGPQPRHAQLAWRVGDAITRTMLLQGVVDSRDQSITPVRATLQSRHDPEAPNAFTIPSLRLGHPLRRPRTSTEFWLFSQQQLEDEARLKSPGELALSMAVDFADIFAGTPYWNGQLTVLRSGRRRISLPNFVLDINDAHVDVPRGPLSTKDIVNYATDVGSLAASRVTGAEDVGSVTLSSQSYRLTPRSHALVPEEGAVGVGQIAIVPPR